MSILILKCKRCGKEQGIECGSIEWTCSECNNRNKINLIECFHKRNSEDAGYCGTADSGMRYCLHKVKKITGEVIDVGSHIGTILIDLLRYHNPSVVHMYEPNPDNFRILSINAKLYLDFVKLYNEAVWYNNSKHNLFRDDKLESKDSHTIYSTSKIGNIFDIVETITPEEMFKRCNRKLEFLKLNCEGGELPIMTYLTNNLSIVDKLLGLSIEVHPGLIDKSQHDYLYLMTTLLRDKIKTNNAFWQFMAATYKSEEEDYKRFNDLTENWPKGAWSKRVSGL